MTYFTDLHNHKLLLTKKGKWLCDNCGKKDKYNLDRRHMRFHCKKCDFDLCFICYKKFKKSNICDLSVENIVFNKRLKKSINYEGMDDSDSD